MDRSPLSLVLERGSPLGLLLERALTGRARAAAARAGAALAGCALAAFLGWRHRHRSLSLERDASSGAVVSGFSFRSVLALTLDSVSRSRRLRNTALLAGALTTLVLPVHHGLDLVSAASPSARERRTFATFFAVCWGLHYTHSVVEVSQARCRMTYFNTALLRRARLNRMYFPVFWMVSGHAMTVFGSIAGDVQLFLWPRLLLEAEALPSFDGANRVLLEWCGGARGSRARRLSRMKLRPRSSSHSLPPPSLPPLSKGTARARAGA